MADQPEQLASLQRLLSEALEIADGLNLDMIAIRISEALERTKELRAQIPSRVQLKAVSNGPGE